MSPDFEKAIEIILQHEVGPKWRTGGYVNHPSDPGGATKYGISLRWLESKGIDIDGDGDVDIDDILALSQDASEQLYFEHFWLPPYRTLRDHYVATKVFDMAVNMGHDRAHKLAQQACNRLGSELLVDGDLGPLSCAELDRYDASEMLHALCEVQAAFYTDLTERKPKMRVFLKGWLRRAAWPWEE